LLKFLAKRTGCDRRSHPNNDAQAGSELLTERLTIAATNAANLNVGIGRCSIEYPLWRRKERLAF
jgi:hypothetical protein